MLSPALLRVCCLAVMAPALTKAVRQADGLTLLILPQKNSTFGSSKTQRADKSGRLSALGSAGERKGDTVTAYPVINGKSWQILSSIGVKSPENTRLSPPDAFTNFVPVRNSNGFHYAKHDWSRVVGVLTPTAENSDFESTMNEDISETQERMGLLNANTSLDYDFRSKIDFGRQCASPICVDMSPKEPEPVDDISVKCPMGLLLSPPGSPKSVSGESTSTVTAHNPSVVTFAELEEAKSFYRKSVCRTKTLLSRLKKLQLMQLERHVIGQLKSLVNHYQKVLTIPCQRPIKHNVVRRSKDSFDMKAEFLQNEDVRNLSTAALVNLVRKYESSNSLGKPHQTTKGSISQVEELLTSDNADLRIKSEDSRHITQVSGSLLTKVKHLESTVDSEATESSSGGESCDEFEGYEDKKLHSIPIHKRALWTWVFGRAPVAKRWTWLQSQVSDLEYRVRQIADLLTQARAAKSSLCFEETQPSEPPSLDTVSLKKSLRSVNGFLDHTSVITSNGYHSVQNVPSSTEILPEGSSVQSISNEDCGTVSRTRPMNPEMFRKRKLLRTTGLHMMSRKAARLSTVRCNCNTREDILPCILCSGRYNNRQSVDPNVMPLLERVALLQPTFHPLLSFEKEVAVSLHFENHLKQSETYYRVPKQTPSFLKKPNLGIKPRNLTDHARSHSKKLTRHAAQTLLSSARYRNSRHARNSSSKLRNHGLVIKKWRDYQKKSLKVKDRLRHWSAASSCSSQQDSPVHSPAAYEDGRETFSDMKKRRDGNQYDIDNIVIPYNLKTTASVKKLQYKEIMTPGWRLKEGLNSTNGPIGYGFDVAEDISDETVIKRHELLEIAERKYLRGVASQTSMARRVRRNFRYDSSGANTPDHVPSYHPDIIFQDSNSFISSGPFSPTISPPPTPSSIIAMSDDSQPSGSTVSASCTERRRTISLTKRGRSADEGSRNHIQEYMEEDYTPTPLERQKFPLSEAVWEEMLKHVSLSPHFMLPETEKDMVESVKEEATFSSPASPESTSSTNSNVEDVTDPEWTIVAKHNGPEKSPLVMKFSKR